MSSFATKRLLKDLKELQGEKENLKTISALPTQDIFLWHCNLRPDEGPYAGTVFHLVLKFGTDYPKTPPSVLLYTPISHPNVLEWFGSDSPPYICLDMLQQYYTNKPYVGWSSAYSVASVLLQLQSFLFAENIPQDYGGYKSADRHSESVAQAILRAREYSCKIIDSNGDNVLHTHNDPWPPLPKYEGKLGMSLSACMEVLGTLHYDSHSGTISLHWGGAPPSQISSEEPTNNNTTNTNTNIVGGRNKKNTIKTEQDSQKEETDIAGDKTTQTSNVLACSSSCGGGDDHNTTTTGEIALSIPSEVYTHLFGFLGPTEIFKARDVCKTWRQIIVTYNLFEKSQISCFHTKSTLDDKNCILGVGVHVEYFQQPSAGRGGGRSASFNNKRYSSSMVDLKSVSSPLDILSLEAFGEQGVRTGVWGKEKFDHFLPLIFNQKHAVMAFPKIQRSVFEIMRKVPPPPCLNICSSEECTSFRPYMILQLLSTLMNTMVVQLMKEVDQEEEPTTRTNTNNNNRGRTTTTTTTTTTPRSQENVIHRHASEKALEGYCAFHHMLLYFAKVYPSIETVANKQIDDFISNPNSRHKNKTPNLGNLLICLTLSKKGWSSLCKPLLLESFDRNVRWLLQKHPKLAATGGGPAGAVPAEERFSKTFNGSITSERLLMFQVYFMNHIGRPAGTRGPADVLNSYNKRLGRPTTAQKEDLQRACKEILAVKKWNDFFVRCGAPVPKTKDKLMELLCGAIVNSRNKKYHRD